MDYKIDHKKLQELTSDAVTPSRYADIVGSCVERYLGLQVLSTVKESPSLDAIKDFLVEAKVLVEKTK